MFSENNYQDKFYFSNTGQGGLPSIPPMRIWVDGAARIQIDFTGARIGSPFGYSLSNFSYNYPQFFGVFTAGNVYFSTGVTPTPTGTPTRTPTLTPTNTLPPGVTPSATSNPTPTPTLTMTQTKTPSPTPPSSTSTPEVTPTPTSSGTPAPTGTPQVTPSTSGPSNGYRGQGNYYVNYKNSGDDVYVSIGYPISAILDKSPGFSTDATNNILSALDFWGQALSGSTFNSKAEASTIYTGTEYVSNPLIAAGNTSLVVFLTASNAGNNGTLGATGIQSVRRSSELYTSQYGIPYRAYMYLNSYYNTQYLALTTAGGKNGFYYTVLHELAHALGVGSLWYSRSGLNLYSCYIVGAGDTTENPLGLGLSANFFYSLSTLNNSRVNTDIGKLTTIGASNYYIGDADYPAAFNLYNTAVSSSHAVSAYNAAFNLNLSAIPVENGLGFGSIGSHWDEGYYGSTVGNDDRKYYGSSTPGAPCLNDELMTPISEGAYDMPCSKITLGALKDLGYTVNYSKSETFSPLIYNVYSNGSGSPFDIGFYGNTYRVAGKTSLNSGKDIILKKGLTKYFYNIL
jgi:hypothetical protein